MILVTEKQQQQNPTRYNALKNAEANTQMDIITNKMKLAVVKQFYPPNSCCCIRTCMYKELSIQPWLYKQIMHLENYFEMYGL